MKTIYWLGSSVTYGAFSNGVSMADYLDKSGKYRCVKDAVNSTTLATNGDLADKSYINRMISGENFNKNEKVDLFICQISTNDAKKDNLHTMGDLNKLGKRNNLNDYNIETTLDSILYIVDYVKTTWNCPVLFYSGAYFGGNKNSPRYSEYPKGEDYSEFIKNVVKVAATLHGVDGYSIKVLDLFNDEEFNKTVSDSDYKKYMADPVHPLEKGYLEWWTPAFESYLNKIL